MSSSYKLKINLCSLFCMMAVFMVTYNYYIYLFPSLSKLFFIIYQICKMFFIFLFVWQIVLVLLKKRKKFNSISNPFFMILVFIFINIIKVILETGSFSILAQDYNMTAAFGTNDQFGYYFSIVTTWISNIGLALWLANNIKDEEKINRCIITTIKMLIIPIILLILMHPEYIGQRTSTLEDVNFGGGVWNIGVFGFTSIAWLAIAQMPTMNMKEKKFVIIGIIILIFAGIVGLSRSFIVLIGISFVYYFLRTKKTISKLTNSIIIMLLLCIMVVLLLISDSSILNSIIGRMSDDTSGTKNVRLLLWEGYLSSIKDYFWFGAPEGGTYNYYYNIVYKGANFLPHSSIINFLILGGIGCLVSYLIILKNIATKLSTKSLKTREIAICMQTWILGYCILAFMNQTGFSQIIFYMTFRDRNGLNRNETRK